MRGFSALALVVKIVALFLVIQIVRYVLDLPATMHAIDALIVFCTIGVLPGDLGNLTVEQTYLLIGIMAALLLCVVFYRPLTRMISRVLRHVVWLCTQPLKLLVPAAATVYNNLLGYADRIDTFLETMLHRYEPTATILMFGHEAMMTLTKWQASANDTLKNTLKYRRIAKHKDLS